jgi:hypothetical protein
LFELLLVMTAPTMSVVAPMAPTSEPRKFAVLKSRASVAACGDDATSFSTSKLRNHPAVPTTGPLAPRMMSALPHRVSKRSACVS